MGRAPVIGPTRRILDATARLNARNRSRRRQRFRAALSNSKASNQSAPDTVRVRRPAPHTNKQQSVTREPRTEINDQLTPSSYQPTANSNQPRATSNNQQRPAFNRQRPAISQPPTSNTQQPTVRSDQQSASHPPKLPSQNRVRGPHPSHQPPRGRSPHLMKPSSLTASYSSWRALMLWSIPARVASEISRPSTTCHSPPSEVTGKPKFRPAGTP